MNVQEFFWRTPVTALLLTSIVALYIAQVVSGVDANNPTTQQLLQWGANVLPLSMGYQPWRLLSSAFLHIGLMHLLFNAFALYFFGLVSEPMFGHFRFLMIFALSAIGGNLLNNYLGWQQLLSEQSLPAISAGASGGIMGLGGALLVAALLHMSVDGLILNLKSLLLIMGINLVYGFAVPGIDNAGHIGGALTGALLAASIGIAHKRHDVAIIYYGLPWLMTTAVAAGFYLFWANIHQQLLPLLA